MQLFHLFAMPGPTEMVLLLGVIVLLFGAKKIPELMGGLGRGINEFKKGKEGRDPERIDGPKED